MFLSRPGWCAGFVLYTRGEARCELLIVRQNTQESVFETQNVPISVSHRPAHTTHICIHCYAYAESAAAFVPRINADLPGLGARFIKKVAAKPHLWFQTRRVKVFAAPQPRAPHGRWLAFDLFQKDRKRGKARTLSHIWIF
jgi:hypothetical protein